MAFVAAMNSPPFQKQGVKGSDVYTEEGVGNLCVALFTQLVRGQQATYIADLVKKIFATKDAQQITDLIVMAFQTRDVRGGKGERDLFTHVLDAILREQPEWSEELVRLVSEYGSWRDMWPLWETKNPVLQRAVEAVVVEQFRLDQESERPSLLAKWMPREGSRHASLAKRFAGLLFPTLAQTPNAYQHLRQYRRTLAYLNKRIDTTEIKMCGRTWAKITPEHVPGRLMKRNKLAFFNQKKARRGSEPDVRWPENEDRVKCAENFTELLKKVARGEVKMKGGQTTMPHEHVREIYGERHTSEEARRVRQAQWNAIRDEVLLAGGLGKVVPMCDFSGSMDGVPKEVSLALGILISEIASPAFRDHILTFDSTPQWLSFAGKTTLDEKVHAVGHLGQGLSTNFQAACDLILQRLVEHKVVPEDAPTDLLVLTDMGFDAACYSSHSYLTKAKPWQTHFQMIRDAFARHGYQPPRIVCWNLRAEYKDFHAQAHEEGVVQLSGWSPAMLKAIQGEGIQVQTPYQGMRKILDAKRYDGVREVVGKLLTERATDVLRSA